MNTRHLATALAALTLCGAAAAQTAAPTPEIQFFGLLDWTVRYSTHQNATGGAKSEMTDGVLTGSRLGLRGKRALGPVSAVYVAEAGFAPDTGTSGQGGRLLGRQLYAGLEGDFGTVLGGRQYTVAHDILSRYESMAFANNSIVGYQGGNYTGLRHDNMLKYQKSFGPVQIQYGHTFGETAGNHSAGSAEALGAVYSDGPLSAGAVYQQTKNVTTAYFGAVAAASASTQKVWGGGASYNFGGAKGFLGYTNSKLDVADYQNNVVYVGTNVQVTDALQVVATLQVDKLKHPGADGDRQTAALLFDYFLDKNTDVYFEIDHTKVKDGWVALANNTALGSGNLFGNDSRTGVMAGLRIKF